MRQLSIHSNRGSNRIYIQTGYNWKPATIINVMYKDQKRKGAHRTIYNTTP